MVSAGSLAARYSPTRVRIYQHLLAYPSRAWTVRELHEALADEDTSANSVRATLYVLLGERVVEQLRGNRPLTLKLNERGHDVLRVLLETWSRQEATQ